MLEINLIIIIIKRKEDEEGVETIEEENAKDEGWNHKKMNWYIILNFCIVFNNA